MTAAGAPRTDPAAIWEAARRAAADRGGAEAFSAPEGSAALGEIVGRADRLSSELTRLGLGGGGIVLVLLPGDPDFLATLLALWRLGHAVALGSPGFGIAEREGILTALRPRAVIAPATGPDPRSSVPATTSAILDSGHRPLALTVPSAPPAPSSAIPLEGSGAALIKFSSGSTGTPKGIVLGADNVLAEAEAVISTLRLGAEDRIFAPVPLQHSYGFDLGVLPALLGAGTLLVGGTVVPRRFWVDLHARGVTVCLGVPSIYRFVLRSAADRPPSRGCVRRLLSCTAPLSAETVTAFHARFGVVLCQHYGSSETGGATVQEETDALAQPNAVGRALDGVSLSIVDPSGAAMGEGRAGRVLVRGRAVARGYVMGAPPEGTPFVPPDGFLMGDHGVLRGGLLYLEGRADDLINVGGLKVSPAEVIAVLQGHPAVVEAAVTGVHDAAGEQAVFAAVVLDGPATEAELVRHCRDRLAEHKVPRRIVIRAELPRGPSGKVRLDPKDVTS